MWGEDMPYLFSCAYINSRCLRQKPLHCKTATSTKNKLKIKVESGSRYRPWPAIIHHQTSGGKRPEVSLPSLSQSGDYLYFLMAPRKESDLSGITQLAGAAPDPRTLGKLLLLDSPGGHGDLLCFPGSKYFCLPAAGLGRGDISLEMRQEHTSPGLL